MSKYPRVDTYAKLKKKLDKYYSLWIRQGGADKNGYDTCCSCGTKGPWKEFDSGHYWSRIFTGTRWDDKNVHPQCKSCNRFKEGSKPAYTLFLIRTYGIKVLEELELKKDHSPNFSSADLEILISEYQKKIKSL